LGFGDEMAGAPAEWIDRIAAPFGGVSHASLLAAGGPLMPEDTDRVPWATGQFKTPTGRFAFPERFDDDPVVAPTGHLHLLFLASQSAMRSQINPRDDATAPLDGRAVVRVHPRTAAGHGLG